MRVHNHILTFTKLATYSASVGLSSILAILGYKSPVEVDFRGYIAHDGRLLSLPYRLPILHAVLNPIYTIQPVG